VLAESYLMKFCLKGLSFKIETMDSKNIKKVINKIVDVYGNNSAETLDKIKDLGFKFATRSGITWGMDDLTVPKQKKELIKQAEEKIRVIDDYYEKGLLSREEKANQVIEVWKKVKTEIRKLSSFSYFFPKSGILNC